MKRKYPFSFANLAEAYLSCRRTKRKSASAAKFEYSFEDNLLLLSRELSLEMYRPGRSLCFGVNEPKIREVWAADFRDRIVHHLLVGLLEPIWEPKYIHHSYACRRNKGSIRAVSALKQILLREGGDIFFLQLDIESFFTNIDKRKLFSILARHERNTDILRLAEIIIFHDPTSNFRISGDRSILASVPKHKSLFGAPLEKGLPIGNHTSQFFANTYLDKLDQFIKHHLKCRYYLRYMDDFILLDHSKARLESWREHIASFLHEELLLRLHPKKQKLLPAKNGIDFVGFIVFPEYMLIRRRVVSNLKRKLRAFDKNLRDTSQTKESHQYSPRLPFFFDGESQIVPDIIEKAIPVINSAYGQFRHADCGGLQRKIREKHLGKLSDFIEPAAPGTPRSFLPREFVRKEKEKKIIQDILSLDSPETSMSGDG